MSTENGQIQGASTATAEMMDFRFVVEATILMGIPI